MEHQLFIELKYGKYYLADLHGCTIAEAQAELIYLLDRLDFGYKCILVVHGYHQGVALKNYIRDKFSSPMIAEKINIDAGSTLLRLKR